MSSSTTLQNDDVIKLPLVASDAVEFRGVLIISSTSATPDIKLTLAVPSGATIRWHGEYFESTSTYASGGVIVASGTTVVLPVTANQIGMFEFQGIVVNGATAGDLQLQWAQNTSNAASIKVEQRSFITGSKF